MLSALLLGAGAAPCSAAGNTASVDRKGVVHSIRTDIWSDGHSAGGTVLVHVAQQPDGSKIERFVPGTDNFTLERDPSIDIDPVTDEPALVFSQVSERSASLYISRFQNGAWGGPRQVWSDGGVHLEPEIDIRQSLLHLVWKQEGQHQERLRLSLDRATLDLAFGPETLPEGDENMIGPDGGDSGSETPEQNLSFFSSVIPPPVAGKPGRIITWGIRDEPVPVVYFQPFQLPSGITSVSERRSEWISGRFTTWFTSGERFYYSTLVNGAWSDTRVIDMEDGGGAADALRLLGDLLRRDEAPAN